MLEFTKFSKTQIPSPNKIQIIEENAEISNEKDIAIIGLALQFSSAETPEQYWNGICNKTDFVTKMSSERLKDTKKTLAILNYSAEGIEDGEAAYLNEIDKFDYAFFRISPREAALMDPNQRLFLQNAWHAVENAGYGNKQLYGSRTGIFIGHGAESEYKQLISALEPSALAQAVPGNVKPIIAGRLAYILDLHGPNMLVDTTCSSSLVAVHLACKSLLGGECDMAIAGGVQLHIAPVRHAEIGIEASDGRARSFDDHSDGTGTGEGLGTVILKPLNAAIRDKDHIYAVIKGSAVNHDGNSNGITAPNARAQEDVILRAWKDAAIDPETITLWEAHGTGTKLGDPIEIDGIRRAFSKYTDKKGFCAIGSVKSNIGHLDHSAGIAGLIKGVLALHHKTLPPALHFGKPNRKISFEDSPVYINDQEIPWETDQLPRRCGISSFGISGTNCHLILEEAPAAKTVNSAAAASKHIPRIFTLSAKSQKSLIAYIKSFIDFLKAEDLENSESAFADLCYSINTGRGHLAFRLAVIAENPMELAAKLSDTLYNLLNDPTHKLQAPGNVYYSEHRVVPEDREALAEGELTERKASQLGSNALKWIHLLHNGSNQSEVLDQICQIYMEGASIEWNSLYIHEQRNRRPLPVYPFERTRCWIEKSDLYSAVHLRNVNLNPFPLLDSYITSTIDSDIFHTEMNVQSKWLLDEHRIGGKAFLVGTAYLEIVSEALRIKLGISHILDVLEFQDIVFLTPMIMVEEETREIQTILIKTATAETLQFFTASRLKVNKEILPIEPVNEWIKHVEGKVVITKVNKDKKIRVSDLLSDIEATVIIPDFEKYNDNTVFEFGPRWRNISEMHVGDLEIIAKIEIPQAFVNEVSSYMLYPPLLDNALATIPLIEKALGSDSNRIFLPFSYKGIRIFHPLPGLFYSHVRLNGEITEKSELLSFDVTIMASTGEVIAEIDQYSLKKVSNTFWENKEATYYGIKWVEYPRISNSRNTGQDYKQIWIVGGESEVAEELRFLMESSGHSITVTRIDKLKIRETYIEIPAEVQIIVYLGEETPPNSDLFEIRDQLLKGTEAFFQLIKALLASGLNQVIQIAIVSSEVNAVDGLEKILRPQHAATFGLGKVVREEYPNLVCRGIDRDKETALHVISAEILDPSEMYSVAFRKGVRYTEQFSIKSVEKINRKIRQGGTYFITGGLSGIGLEIGKALAAEHKVNLVLIGRRALPPRGKWSQIIAAGNEMELIKRIQGIYDIEANGSLVEIYSGDVADYNQLEFIFASARSKFGKINGIIHSAGIAGKGFLIHKSYEELNQIWAPKILGTVFLDQLSLADELDFFICFSSNTTLMGIPGQGDYTAGNAFQDAYSSYQQLQGRSALTINWPAWKETGMAFDQNVLEDTLFRSLRTVDGIRHFFQLLGQVTNRYIVGEILYEGSIHGKTIMDALIKLEPGILNEIEKNRRNQTKLTALSTLRTNGKSSLIGRNSENYSALEYQIADIWNEILGLAVIHAYDSFFEIGGDSIMVTKIHRLLDQQHPGVITVADLFTFTTISQIAAHIEKQIKHPHKDQESNSVKDSIQAILDQLVVGNMDVNQALAKYNSIEMHYIPK
ncbi:SDR family oxidoreductase [Paenibacillus psychroresistens]|uniref:SDR family oxidoreductase n=1 Tax=Paenibacillus psychroresistens TaxID=1778678 RepID=A0A6B8RIN6_9BACL|nr:type I polyketide synthase [Paenibacillus psychroresistens]QGQ96120.1 SDR family oxidoreductase [Paenibacillus psychroresistens]